ncbi:MAG: flagellin lysine-N-methylase, partial [Clostridia bacterium]|nr:flagellin lysine-N-methylase [Clostridia bacterium]
MKLIAPDYYDKFSCIADKCRHSCCVGWEIDIDEDTYSYYKSIGGELGKALQANIAVCDGTANFTLDENERCPFLEKDGLCRLIKELGESSLCNICADHPRFRSFYSQRTEIGLGLCCEAAAELILSQQHKVTLVTLKDDTEVLTEDEEYLLKYRNQLFAIAQDRDFTVEERLENLLDFCGIDLPEKSFSEWAEIYLSLERLDEEWTDKLSLLKKAETYAIPSSLEIPFEQLLVYLLYRYIPSALDDGDISSKIGFAVLS